MKRPALYVGIPFVLGLTLASAVELRVWMAPVGGIVLLALAVLFWRRDLWKYVLLSTLSVLTACCVYWGVDVRASESLRYAGQETVFTGKVIRAVTYQSGYARYDLKGTFPDGTCTTVEWFTAQPIYDYGDTLTLSGTPDELNGSYLFDSASDAKSRNIRLLFGLDTQVTAYAPLEKTTLRSIIYRWRSTMTRRIRAQMGEETGAMLVGMLFGDKSTLTYASRKTLSHMGIGHILAVSGMHLDFLALIAGWLLKRLKAGRGLQFAAIMTLCGLFVLCAGETVSVKRACIMIGISQLGRLWFRQVDALNSMSIAGFLLGLENPFAVHSAAFWLSFTATFGVAVLASYMTGKLPRENYLQHVLADFLACCWAFLAILPVTAVYFREVSFVSPLSNTFLVPLCMGSLLFGMLAVVCGAQGLLAELFLGGADVMNGWILSLSRMVEKIPGAYISTGSEVLLFTMIAGAVFAAGMYLIGRNRRMTAVAILGAVLVSAVSVQAERVYTRDTLRMAILGEGKQTLIAVTDGSEALLFDLTGGTKLPQYAEAYLSENGVSSLRGLYLSRTNARSVQRYETYLDSFRPASVWNLSGGELANLYDIVPAQTVHTELSFHGAHITAEKGAVTVEFAGQSFVFTNDGEAVETFPQCLCICGKTPEQLPDCGILVLTDTSAPVYPDDHTYIGEQQLELTAAQNGTCRVRRLYGEN